MQITSHDFEWFSSTLNNVSLVNRLKEIKLVIADIDGSMTDGMITYNLDGESGRNFSIQDGFATARALKSGLLIAFLSGKDHNSAQLRAKKLGIPDDLCVTGCEDKITYLLQMQKSYNSLPAQTIMYGDDFLDARVKAQQPELFLVVPNNIPFYFHQTADLVLPKNGGDNAFRLLLDILLFVQGKHFAQEYITQTLSR